MKKRLSIILIFALVVTTYSCNSGKSDSDKALKGEINIDGSSTVFPITEAIAEEFRMVYPDVKVTIGVSGTGGGFKKFARKETHISNASTLIKDSEIQLCNENNVKFIGLEIAIDGMAVVVNKDNNWVETLTVEELKKIWSPEAQGTIMKWNQIRSEWPDKEIHLFGPGVASGTFDYFTDAIVGKSGSSRGDFTASEDDNVLVQGIKGDLLSLGFFGLGYYEENQAHLKVVAVDNGKGPVFPSLETITNGTYSPLSRPLLIYINSEAAKKEEVQAFVRFYLDNAPVLVKEVGYDPLPLGKYAEQKLKFEDFLKSLN